MGRKPSKSKNKEKRINIRLSEQELQTVQRAAELKSLTPGTYARMVVLERARLTIRDD